MLKYQICGSFFHSLLPGLLHRWVKCILEVRNMKNGSCTSIFKCLLPKCQTGKWVKNTATCFLNYLVTLVVRNMKAWPICCFLLLGGHMKNQWTKVHRPYSLLTLLTLIFVCFFFYFSFFFFFIGFWILGTSTWHFSLVRRCWIVIILILIVTYTNYPNTNYCSQVIVKKEESEPEHTLPIHKILPFFIDCGIWNLLKGGVAIGHRGLWFLCREVFWHHFQSSGRGLVAICPLFAASYYIPQKSTTIYHIHCHWFHPHTSQSP